MKSIHIRDIDENVLDALKRLAGSHYRSLQGELHFILERAAVMAPPEDRTESFSLNTVNTGRKTTWTREEIYDSGGR